MIRFTFCVLLMTAGVQLFLAFVSVYFILFFLFRMFLLECDARHHFAVPVVELYGIRKKLCINRTSFLCF